MLFLFFPNFDALRLALASGILPVAVTHAEVSAISDCPSGIWLRPKVPLSKESLAALAHIGVRPFASPNDQNLRTLPCWAAALPLKRGDDGHSAQPVLFEVPTTRLASFLRELHRSKTQPERYRIDGDLAFVHVSVAPLYWIEQSQDKPNPGIRSYRRAGPNFWVQSGWHHLLPTAVNPDADETILVSASGEWRTLERGPWRTSKDVLQLRPGLPNISNRSPRPELKIELWLKPRTSARSIETFWIHDGSLATLRSLLEPFDHRTILQLEMAVLEQPQRGNRVAIRIRRDTGVLPFVWPLRAFVAHPQSERLMIPADCELTPALRTSALQQWLALNPGEIAWLEPDAGTIQIHRVARTAFRPISDWIRYTAPQARCFPHVSVPDNPFACPGFVAISEPTSNSPPVPSVTSTMATGQASGRTSAKSSRFWFAKWAGKLFSKPQDPGYEPELGEPEVESDASDAPRRSTLTQQERIARRAELEEFLYRQDSFANPKVVGQQWAELAELYAESGNLTDAPLCWLHSLWCTPLSSEHAWQQWDKVEARGAKSSLRITILELIHLALAPPSKRPVSTVTDYKSISAELTAAEETLPCRMVWLARWSLATLGGGDVLMLAHGRDRLFARLRTETALAALDTPSFLRFRGLMGSDRYSLARDWLLRCREPIQRWVKKQSATNRLAWAGIGADLTSTSAYADWMFAWGFAKLGDQIRANELIHSATRALQAPLGSTAVPEVHRRLQELFLGEVRAALGATRDSTESTVHETPAQLELADYTVAKLIAHSEILSRHRTRSEFGARPLLALMGDDDFGRHLSRILDGTATATLSVIRPLLDEVAKDRTAGTLPRVILTLLEIVGDASTATEVLEYCPTALEQLPEALRLRNVQDSESSSYLIRLGSRGVELVCQLAIQHSLPNGLQLLVNSLDRSLSDGDPPTRAIFRQSATPLFRALSRCGLTGELRSLITRWARVGVDDSELYLSAAIGWYSLGETERGNRILDTTRDKLFVQGLSDERDRTRTALAYAKALAFAPPRLALGRLEELFQRLGTISSGGATARYFALKPLELIDVAITAIVNEDFSLGPEVRSWLDVDELRIRTRITRDLDAAMAGLNG